MRAKEVANTAHILVYDEEPDTPEGFDFAARDYHRGVHHHAPINPNIKVILNTGKETEALRKGLVWLVSSWQQLQDALRGPGSRENSLARRCPYFK